MNKLEEILNILSQYKGKSKEDMFMQCLEKRLNDTVQVYENSLSEAVKHLSLYRKDVVVLNKYSKGDKNDRHT